MTQQRTDQPDNVSTQETPRPPDESVVTSDIESDVTKPGAEDHNVSATAAAPDKDGPTDSDAATEKPKKTPPKRNRSAERRIKRLSSKLSDAEAKDAENARRIAELEDQVDSLKSATPKAKEPMLQDFANPREYAKAYAKWEAADSEEPAPKPRGRKPKPKADPPPTHRQTTPDKEIIAFQDRGKAKLGDEFMEALTEPTAVNQLMGEFMLDHDLGPEMYVHLANNPDEAKKIYDSSTPRAIKAMEALAKKATDGQLDAGDPGDDDQVDDQDDELEDTPPRKRTKAPEPPADTRDSGDADLQANPESESMDEYAARRRKEEARKAGAIV